MGKGEGSREAAETHQEEDEGGGLDHALEQQHPLPPSFRALSHSPSAISVRPIGPSCTPIPILFPRPHSFCVLNSLSGTPSPPPPVPVRFQPPSLPPFIQAPHSLPSLGQFPSQSFRQHLTCPRPRARRSPRAPLRKCPSLQYEAARLREQVETARLEREMLMGAKYPKLMRERTAVGSFQDVLGPRVVVWRTRIIRTEQLPNPGSFTFLSASAIRFTHPSPPISLCAVPVFLPKMQLNFHGKYSKSVEIRRSAEFPQSLVKNSGPWHNIQSSISGASHAHTLGVASTELKLPELPGNMANRRRSAGQVLVRPAPSPSKPPPKLCSLLFPVLVRSSLPSSFGGLLSIDVGRGADRQQ